MNPSGGPDRPTSSESAPEPGVLFAALEAAGAGHSLDDNGVNGTGVIDADAVSADELLLIRQHADSRKRLIRYGVLAAILVVGLSLVGLRHATSNKSLDNAKVDASQRFNNTTIPLTDLGDSAAGLSIQNGQTLSINGQLNVNNSLVLTPGTAPTGSVAGQLYYDKTSNNLEYYNGSTYVNVLGGNSIVSSLGGATGNLSTGSGLSVSGTTLSNTGVVTVGGQSGSVGVGVGLAGGNGQLTNTGVLSLQGQAGNISLTAGGGIAISGTAISSTGVLALGGQNGNISIGTGLDVTGGNLRNTGIISAVGAGSITVTNDGNGNITIDGPNGSGGGGGTVSSPGGTIGKIAKFTGVQTIADSLLSESGATVTVSGNLHVTGALNLDTALTVTNGGTGATTASGARTNLGAAASGANSDITSLTGLSTALTVAQGGTGVGTLATNGVLIGNGSSAISAITGSTGQCLLANTGNAPTFGVCPGSGGVSSINGLTGVVALSNASGLGSTITINDATTAGKGIASFNSTNFSVTSGAVNTIQNINTGSSPTFVGLTLSGALSVNNLTPTAAATLGVTGQNLTLQGATTKVTATSGVNTTTLSFAAPTANVTYQLQTATAGTYSICTTAGNCVGTGGGVTTSGGTTDKLVKFSGSQSIADSIISDNGTTATISGNLQVNGTVNFSTPLPVASGGTGTNSIISNGVVIGQGSSALATVTAVSAGQCLVSTAGAPVFQTCPGTGGVVSINGLTGTPSIANASTGGSTITINDASVAGKGIASFNSTNFTVTSGAVNTIQNINSTAAPTFGQLSLTSSQAANPMLLINNTNVSATGNLLDVQLNGTSKLKVAPNGDTTIAGAVTAGSINGQTISSSANFTGTVAVGSTLSVNTITPTGALTVGSNGQSFTLQGNTSSTIKSTNGTNTTTLAFQNPTANVTYNFTAAGTGSYDVCTTAGNCAGVGGSVTTAGGTAGTIAKFTSGSGIGNSIISDNGSTVTIGGTLSVNTLTPTGALTVGSTGQNLTLQGASVSLSATASGVTNSLTFTTPTGSNKTVTVPNASGTVAVSASGPLSIDALGNLSCPTCLTSGGGGAGGVSSLNTATGALVLQGVSAGSVSLGGSTLTINDASSSIKGLASFDGTNLVVTSGAVNTAQGITVGSTPTFAGLNLTAALSVTNGGTGSATASGARTNLGAAASGSNSDITSLSGLTTALSAVQGGTGITTTPTNGQILIGNGSGYSLNTLTAGAGVTITNSIGGITIAAGGAGTCTTCATTALNNLASVAINTSLLPGAANGASLGSATLPFGQLFLGGTSSSPGTNNFKFTGVSTGGTRTLTLPDASGTVAVSASGYLSLNTTTGNLTFVGPLAVTDGGTGATSASGARTNLGAAASGANSDITALSGLTTALSVIQGGTGSTSASGARTTLGAAASGANSDITALSGLTTALSVIQGGTGVTSFTNTNGLIYYDGSKLVSAGAGATGQCLLGNSGGAPSFGTCTGAGGVSSITASTTQTGAITLQGTTNQITVTNSGGTFTFAGPQNLDTAANVAFGTVNATTLIQTNGTTRIDASGNLSNIGTINASGLITSTGGISVANSGAVAYQKGADYSTVGSQNDIALGAGVLFRLTGATAQTITGIAGGANGRIITLVNAGANTATIANSNTSSLAANRITTGTGADLALPSGATITLIYDSGASLWRVEGDSGSSAGTYIQNSLSYQAAANFNIGGTGIGNSLEVVSGSSIGFDVSSAGTLNFGSTYATTVNLATNATAHTIAIGTGAAAQAISIGSTNTTSALTLQAGSGGINLTGTVTLNGLTGGTSTCLTLDGSNHVGTSTCATGSGSSPTLQNVYDNSGASAKIVLNSTAKGIVIQDNATPVGGNLLSVQSNGGGSTYFGVTTTGIATSGTATINGDTTIKDSSATAFRIQNGAGSTTLLNADVTNSRISIGSIGTATAQLYISGSIPANNLGSATTGNTAPRTVFAQGNYVYVGESGSLNVYDASNPASLTSIGGISTFTNAQSLYVQGHYAYMVYSGGTGRLMVVDVSNPSSPVTTSTTILPSAGKSIYVQGHYAYVVLNNGNLQIYDVTNPASLVSIGSISVQVSPCNGADLPTSVVVSGSTAYVGVGTGSGTEGCVVSVNVSNPASLSINTSYQPGTAGAVTSLYAQGRYLYAVDSTSDKLFVIDASSPTSLSVTGSVATNGNPDSVFVQGRYAYTLNDSSNVLQAFDVSTSSTPVSIGSSSTGGTVASLNGPESIFVEGRYGYTVSATSKTLSSYDLGGEYVQQFEAGGVVTNTATVNNDLTVGGNISIQGGLTIAQSSLFNASVSISGALTTTGLITSAGGLTVGSNGAVSYQKGTDYSTTGSQNDVVLGAGVLFRLTGASAQTITGIAGGTDGRIITLVNAASQTATISNNSSSSLAANRITSGSGADLSLPAGATITLVYDSGASLWRVSGSAAGTGVNAIGAISGTSNANGATITSSTLNLTAADATNGGVVTNTTQTFAGAKSFAALLTGNAGLTVNGGAIALAGNTTSNLSTSSGALTLQGAGGVTLNTTGTTVSSGITIQSGNSSAGTAGTVSIDTGTSSSGSSTLNLGATNALTTNIGNLSTGAGVNINSGNGAITLQASGGAGGVINVGINSGTAGVNLGYTGGTTNINGSTLNIGASATAQTITIGNSTGGTSIQESCGTGNCNFGTNAIAHTTNIGSVTGAATTNIQAGTGGLNLGANGVANTIQIGNSNSSGAQFISVGTNISATSSTFINIGSAIQNSYTAIQSGTGGISFLTNGASASIVAKSGTNSTTAFQIQNASAVALFNADTSTGTITFGTGSNTVIFTAAGGLVASGTAQHTKTIALNAEYAGAVLDAQSDSTCTAATNGTMTSGYDGTSDQSYYNWIGMSAAQCYDVVVHTTLPADFNGWSSSTPLTIKTYTTDTTTGFVNVDLRDGTHTGVSGCSYVSATPASNNTWTTSGSGCNFSTGTFAAGNTITLRIRMTAGTSSNVRIGDITMSYNSKF